MESTLSPSMSDAALNPCGTSARLLSLELHREALDAITVVANELVASTGVRHSDLARAPAEQSSGAAPAPKT